MGMVQPNKPLQRNRTEVPSSPVRPYVRRNPWDTHQVAGRISRANTAEPGCHVPQATTQYGIKPGELFLRARLIFSHATAAILGRLEDAAGTPTVRSGPEVAPIWHRNTLSLVKAVSKVG